MNAININREKLLGIVRENREKHQKEFLEAVEDYKLLRVQFAADNLEIAQKNVELTAAGRYDDLVQFKYAPGGPNSYTKDYDRATRMLELSVDDTIELEEDVFNQLVLDEWHWKNNFSVSNVAYKSALSSASSTRAGGARSMGAMAGAMPPR